MEKIKKKYSFGWYRRSINFHVGVKIISLFAVYAFLYIILIYEFIEEYTLSLGIETKEQFSKLIHEISSDIERSTLTKADQFFKSSK